MRHDLTRRAALGAVLAAPAAVLAAPAAVLAAPAAVLAAPAAVLAAPAAALAAPAAVLAAPAAVLAAPAAVLASSTSSAANAAEEVETPIAALWRRREAITPEYGRLERALDEAQAQYERLKPAYADAAALTVREAHWIAENKLIHPHDDERKRSFATAAGIRDAVAKVMADPVPREPLLDGLLARLAATEAYEAADAAAEAAAGVDEADAAFDEVFRARRDLDAAILVAPVHSLSDLRRKAAIVRDEFEGSGLECVDGVCSLLAALLDPPPETEIARLWIWRTDLAADLARLVAEDAWPATIGKATRALDRADARILALPALTLADLAHKAEIVGHRSDGGKVDVSAELAALLTDIAALSAA